MIPINLTGSIFHLEAFIAPSLVVDVLMKSTLFLVLALGICFFMRRAASTSSKHHILALTMLALIGLPFLSALGPQWNILPSSWTMSEGDKSITSTSQSPTTEIVVYQPVEEMPLVESIQVTPDPIFEPEPLQQYPTATSLELGVDTADIKEVVITEPMKAWSWALVVWIVGCSALLIRFLVANIVVSKKAKHL